MGRRVFATIQFEKKYYKPSKKFKNDECCNSLELYDCEAIECCYEYPLKIMIPSFAANSLCQWIYPIIFGGGLVEEDNITITLKVAAKCCVLVTSLSFPKVYRCENNRESQQHWICHIESGALTCFLSDPLVCFKQASYSQTQTFHLAIDSNLVLLDWFTSGRYERGERWAFTKLRSTSTIFVNNILSFKESQIIQNTTFMNIERAMKSTNIIGTCMIIGPNLEPLTNMILKEVGRCKKYGEKANKRMLFSASPLQLNETNKQHGCIIRFSGDSVHDTMRKIEKLLHPLYNILGENPFIKK